MSGKGSVRRPGDDDAFASNYERIFGTPPAQAQFVLSCKAWDQLLRDEYEPQLRAALEAEYASAPWLKWSVRTGV